MSDHNTVRLDKWLWAARFFKSRALAGEAASGGKIHINGSRAKPARPVRIGDEIEIRRGPITITVAVRELSERRGPASEAVLLYAETEASETEREAARAARTAAPPEPLVDYGGRPSKRDRRARSRLRGR